MVLEKWAYALIIISVTRYHGKKSRKGIPELWHHLLSNGIVVTNICFYFLTCCSNEGTFKIKIYFLVVFWRCRDYVLEIFFILYQDYKQRGAYILTQAPLDNTVEDFWCMISQYEIGTIVMLNSLKEEKEVDFASYTYIPKWGCS